MFDIGLLLEVVITIVLVVIAYQVGKHIERRRHR